MAKCSASVTLDSLVDLACRDGVDVRSTLARVLTDLYTHRPMHTAEEETQYVELMLGLIDSIDSTTHALVADKLRQYSNAPAMLLQKLDGRPDEINETRADLVELFFSAAPDDRRLILTNLDVVSYPARRRPMPSGAELVRRLEGAVLRRNPAEFSRVLAHALNIGRSLAERITYDNSGEPIVVTAKALGMKGEVLQRILLFLNPTIGQSVQRIFELSRLFDELNPAAAERMVAIWQSTSAGPHARHQAIYWDDERSGVRSSDLRTPAYPASKSKERLAKTKASAR
ncbi:MAG TPA: hypothetical protein VH558_10095 [Pseudolabrys sp.]